MANNLTGQVRNIAEVSSAIAQGDLSRKITVQVKGEMFELKKTINTMVDQLGPSRRGDPGGARGRHRRGARRTGRGPGGLRRVARADPERELDGRQPHEPGPEHRRGDHGHRQGDLGKKITVDARGEILALKNTINATVDKLNHVSAEVNRVARLVGTEGTLGVQAEVKDVSGVWRELTDNVNLMGRNLTDQVRDIARVTTASPPAICRRRSPSRSGRGPPLKDTINAMVDSLSLVRLRGHPDGPGGRHRGRPRRTGRVQGASAGSGRS